MGDPTAGNRVTTMFGSRASCEWPIHTDEGDVAGAADDVDVARLADAAGKRAQDGVVAAQITTQSAGNPKCAAISLENPARRWWERIRLGSLVSGMPAISRTSRFQVRSSRALLDHGL